MSQVESGSPIERSAAESLGQSEVETDGQLSAWALLEEQPNALSLPSGTVVRTRVEAETEWVTIASAGGVTLTVELGADGRPRLHFDAAELALRADQVKVECETFDLTSEQDARIESRRGDVALRANDAVRADGEEVLLNCEGEQQDVPSWFRERLELAIDPAAGTVSRRDATGDLELLELVKAAGTQLADDPQADHSEPS